MKEDGSDGNIRAVFFAPEVVTVEERLHLRYKNFNINKLSNPLKLSAMAGSFNYSFLV